MRKAHNIAWIVGIVLVGQAAFGAHIRDEPPVTSAEVQASLAQAGRALASILHLSNPELGAATSTTASRSEIIAGFWKLYTLARPKFRFSPRPIKVLGKPAELTLTILIKYGFVAPVGPLTLASRINFSLDEYGDALGMFLARTAELTHTPSSQWSPYLQRDRETGPIKKTPPGKSSKPPKYS